MLGVLQRIGFWYLILNYFQGMPAWIWVISQGTLMDLGIQIPQMINLLSHVLLQTLSFSHVLRAQLLLLDPGSMGEPSPASSQGPSPQHLHLRYLHSSGARLWGRSQMSQNERCTERHQGETRDSVHGFGKTQREARTSYKTRPQLQQLCLGGFDLTT